MSDNLTLMLNKELATRTAQPEFTQLMQLISQYEVQSSNVRVTTDAEYQMATDSLVAVAGVTKDLENMRKEIVAYPNTFTSTVNATFRGLKDRCQKTRERIEYHTRKYKDKKDAEYAEQQAAAAAAVQEVPVQDVDSGEMTAPQPPTPPPASTKGTNGGSVSFRKGKDKIEVVNPAKLVRAALNARSKVPMEIVQVDAAALRRVVEGGLYTRKQWEKYGVKVTEGEDIAVVRS